MLPPVRVCAARLLGGLLQDYRGTGDIAPANVLLVDPAKLPHPVHLIRNGDLGHFLPEPSTGSLEQIDPLPGQGLAGHLGGVVLGALHARHVNAELVLHGPSDLAGSVPASQGLDDKVLMGVGEFCHYVMAA